MDSDERQRKQEMIRDLRNYKIQTNMSLVQK